MSGVTCREARELLRKCAAGAAVPDGTPGWKELSQIGAIAGTPQRPSLTPAGEQGLREIELRAYRADDWPLSKLIEENQRVSGLIDEAGKVAEFFLTTLGPITPSEALPYLRIVAVGLANRRVEHEELVEQFRQVWGMAEVMGGDARDRLLAAELLDATGAAMTDIYAPMVSTAEQLRSFGAVQSVTSAAILHIDPARAPAPPIEAWREARRSMPTDEMAALFAMVSLDPKGRASFEAFRSSLARAGEMGGQIGAALYLASIGADPALGVDRILKAAGLLSEESGRPLLLASLLTHGPGLFGLSPEELVEWVHFASAVAKRREIAATEAEFEALGVAIVEGLPRDAFANPPPPPVEPSLFGDAVTLLALHAWVYRGILDPSETADLASE